MKTFFITGTDTGVGKTFMACRLLEQYNRMGLKTIGLKPVASGVLENGYNEDALLLQKASSVKLTYTQVNPICFKTPIAPNIASKIEKIDIKIETLVDHVQRVAKLPHDVMIIEGVGGVYVPFNERQTQLDFIKALSCPVILVVGIRLGCLNHSLLSLDCLRRNHIPLEGWIGNPIDPLMMFPSENIETLKQWMGDLKFLVHP